MVRKYKKRTYKPRKRTYKRRYYKRRYYKRRYKPVKKPEIHIMEGNLAYSEGGADHYEVPFNHSQGMGWFNNLTTISSINNSNGYTDIDEIEYVLTGNNGTNKKIEGRKIRLKYLYIKGYIKVGASTAEDADDFNCKLMLFRWKRNTINSSLIWGNLLNNTNNNIDMSTPSTWTETDRLNMMYKQDWKNDIKINFYKKVKNLYRKYDDANNIIPFKMRIPLYDCVLTCDSYRNSSSGKFYAQPQPSTNGLYFTFLSNKYDANTIISYKYKLYYTDY